MILDIMFIFVTCVLLLSALMVIVSKNPVYSILFLVLCFVSSSCLLFLLECEFIALLFIIIYVGAIAILFLFVVMMLDTKTYYTTKDTLKYFPVGSFLGFVLLGELIFLIQDNFKSNPYNYGDTYIEANYENWFEMIDPFNDMQAVGQILYTDYVLQFIIAGVILLVAVIGAVMLTLQKNNTSKYKTQNIFKQLSRNYRNSLWY